MVGSAESAEEISQETFIRAFNGLRSFRRKASFGTWLYRITMNLCYDELKKHSEQVELSPDFAIADASESPSEKIADAERKLWLERQIQKLPFKQKSVLVLRIFRGMPFKDVAKAVGCSTNSAKVNYRHAILKLKNAVADTGGQL
jgi:RNA polymerase sigma-70 factor (ECF subfamily)